MEQMSTVVSCAGSRTAARTSLSLPARETSSCRDAGQPGLSALFDTEFPSCFGPELISQGEERM